MSKSDWNGKHFSFYQNIECEYFPCHKEIKAEQFNCLFCYCPLYILGKDCGGNPKYVENGIKDCTDCVLPHQKCNYGYVTGQFSRIASAAALLEKMK